MNTNSCMQLTHKKTKTIETRPTNMISNTADMPTNQCLQGIGWNFTELSAAVHELSCVQKKNSDEHNTIRRYRVDSYKNLLKLTKLSWFLAYPAAIWAWRYIPCNQSMHSDKDTWKCMHPVCIQLHHINIYSYLFNSVKLWLSRSLKF